ncbi:MAG: potassium channel family protein [Bryobacteraceae bacterium]
MRILAGLIGLILLLIILWDGFEVIILPRRVARRVRLSQAIQRSSWFLWSRTAVHIRNNRRRERYLSFYGPLSLLVLVAVWAAGMVLAFGMLHWSVETPAVTFRESMYMSGTTFITLGLGDVVPHTTIARVVTVIEAGTGFGFLAMVISYLPVFYQSFARRETSILLLDARAGSPPVSSELFRRYGTSHALSALDELLREWEIWSADLLESYISYPMLAYFRSQHDNQSWLAALTAILDVCAVIIAGLEGVSPWQARLTFAMARHTVVDLAQIVNAPPNPPQPPRLSKDGLATLKASLEMAGMRPANPQEFDANLERVRKFYEPYVHSLSRHLLLNPAAWIRSGNPIDNWRTSAWERSSSGLPPSIFDDPDDVH